MSLTRASRSHDEKGTFSWLLNVFHRFRPCERMRKHVFAGRNTQQQGTYQDSHRGFRIRHWYKLLRSYIAITDIRTCTWKKVNKQLNTRVTLSRLTQHLSSSNKQAHLKEICLGPNSAAWLYYQGKKEGRKKEKRETERKKRCCYKATRMKRMNTWKFVFVLFILSNNLKCILRP